MTVQERFWIAPNVIESTTYDRGSDAVKRSKGDLKAIFCRSRGWSIRRTLKLDLKLRGWINDFRELEMKICLAGTGQTVVASPALVTLMPVETPLRSGRVLLQLSFGEERSRK